MSRTIEEKIAVMQACAEGNDIEFYSSLLSKWVEVNSPEFNWGIRDYRIKPEPEWIPQWGEAVWVRDKDSEGWKEGIFGYMRDNKDYPYWVFMDDGEPEKFAQCKPRPQPIFMRKDAEIPSAHEGLGYDGKGKKPELFLYKDGRSAPIELINVESQDNE